MRLSAEDFNAVVRQAMASIPSSFHEYLDNVVVEVRRRPDRALLESLEEEDSSALFGAYVGRPLTDRGVEDTGALPDRVYLFQENLERACSTRTELLREIRLTVLHEIGHHFGLDEDDLDALGYG